jgi:hypothetical protein
MVSMLLAGIVRGRIGMYVRHRCGFVLHRRKAHRPCFFGEARRGSAAERQCDARTDHAREIGKGNQPSRRYSNSPP